MSPHVRSQLIDGYNQAMEERGTGSVARQKVWKFTVMVKSSRTELITRLFSTIMLLITKMTFLRAGRMLSWSNWTALQMLLEDNWKMHLRNSRSRLGPWSMFTVLPLNGFTGWSQCINSLGRRPRWSRPNQGSSRCVGVCIHGHTSSWTLDSSYRKYELGTSRRRCWIYRIWWTLFDLINFTWCVMNFSMVRFTFWRLSISVWDVW